MALAATLETLDGVPDAVAEHYEADGDTYRLRVDGYDDTGLKATLEDVKGKNERLRQRLGKVPEDLDLKLAKLAELEQQHATLEEKRKMEAGEWESLKADLEARHGSKVGELTTTITDLTGQLEKIVKRDAARDALTSANAIVEGMLPHVLDRIDVTTENGEYKAVAKGLDGEPTDIAGLVKQMDESGKYEWGFQPNGATGGGSGGRGGAGGANRIRTKADLGSPDTNPEAHVAYIQEHGQEAYAALPRGE